MLPCSDLNIAASMGGMAEAPIEVELVQRALTGAWGSMS